MPNLYAIWMSLILWSLAAALGAWCIDRFRERLHPHTQHRFAWALLLALPLMIGVGLVMHVFPNAHPLRLTVTVIPMSVPIYPGQALVQEVGEAIDTVGLTWSDVGRAMTLAVWLWLAVGVALTGWRWLRLQRWRRTLRPADPHHLHPDVLAWERASASNRHVTYVISDEATTPMTFGWQQPIVVVPSALLDSPEALRAALMHEYAHIRRGDYLAGLAQQAIRSAFVWHPLVRVLSDQMDCSREVLCDAEVLRAPGFSSQDYAALVCQVAAGPSLAMPVVCMAHPRSSNLLTQRIHAMKHAIQPQTRSASRRSAWMAAMALGVLLAATFIWSGPAAYAQTATTPAVKDVEYFALHDGLEVDQILRLDAEQTLQWEYYNMSGDRVRETHTMTLPAGFYQVVFDEPIGAHTDQMYSLSWKQGAVKTFTGADQPKTSRTYKQASNAVVTLRRVFVSTERVDVDAIRGVNANGVVTLRRIFGEIDRADVDTIRVIDNSN